MLVPHVVSTNTTKIAHMVLDSPVLIAIYLSLAVQYYVTGPTYLPELLTKAM